MALGILLGLALYAIPLLAMFLGGWAEARNDHPTRWGEMRSNYVAGTGNAPPKGLYDRADPEHGHRAVRSWIVGAFAFANVVLAVGLVPMYFLLDTTGMVLVAAGFNVFIGSLIMAAAAGYQLGLRQPMKPFEQLRAEARRR